MKLFVFRGNVMMRFDNPYAVLVFSSSERATFGVMVKADRDAEISLPSLKISQKASAAISKEIRVVVESFIMANRPISEALISVDLSEITEES